MTATSRYSLDRIDRNSNQAQLARDGKPLDVEVQGVVIEAQFELPGGEALLWLTEDSPYDEGLHVYLLDLDGRVRDSVEAGATFAPGILEIEHTGGNWVQFRFFTNHQTYQLEVKGEPEIRLGLPAGWRYKKLLGRHRLIVRAAEKGV